MPRSAGFPEPAREIPRRRLGRLRWVVVAVLILLLARLWTLQVVDGAPAGQATGTAAVGTRTVTVPASRGLVLDRHGTVLVGNAAALRVTVDRAALARLADDRRRALFADLAAVLHTSAERLRLRTVPCSDGEAVARKLSGPDCFNGSSVEPAVLATTSGDAAVRIAEAPEDFPTVTVVDAAVRSYPHPSGSSAGPVLGFVSLANQDDLDRAEAQGSPLDRNALVGHSGLEQQYDGDLRGTPGTRTVAVDRLGRAVGVTGEEDGTAGLDLVTSLDAGLQARTEKELAVAMRQARKRKDPETGKRYRADGGAAVVMDIHTGAVLALASSPDYDPDLFVGGLTAGEAEAVYGEDSGSPTVNRAVSSTYAPGSTFKPFTTIGALRAGMSFDTTYPCPSSLRIGDTTFGNFESEAFGAIDFARAIAVSCNTFFYQVGYDLWRRDGGSTPHEAHQDVARAAEDFGLGRRTGVDLPGEAAGRVPDRRWRRDHWLATKAQACRKSRTATSRTARAAYRDFCRDGGIERAGDAVLTAIGQGDVLATPLQLAVAYAAIGNGGTRWEPRLADRLVAPETGETVRTIAKKKAGTTTVTRTQLRELRAALRLASHEGTSASAFRGLPADRLGIGAKTGTAEVAGKQTTAWLATVNQDYAIVMMIAQGGTGGGATGTAVRHLWEALYGVHDGTIHPGTALAPAAKVRAMQERAR